ncbi:jg23033 [Pararge aegeria aegeria]|uniref:Jg23033 protein n=2 Tax=Pararge aegeria TaxID=116150 RepID=A0A8S4SRF1_9NEOP|nr:jg23033 [Pararge aegeria aegeria]
MRLIILITFLLVTICSVKSDHLVVGNIGVRSILAHEETVAYNPFPFMKRVKTYFYTDPRNRPIMGIQAIDLLHSKASVNITAGGLGQSFVHLRMKSERGSGLEYSIGIYVGPDFQ